MSRPQIRANQLITTFGPGAMVDFPDKSVIIAGLERWTYDQGQRNIVEEPRLAAKLAQVLRKMHPGFHGMSLELRTPPPAAEMIFQRGLITPGVTGYVFPHWFIAQNVTLSPEKFRQRPLVMRGSLEANGRFRVGPKTYSVVPVRFVRACRKGHVGDIQWREFVHQGQTACQQDLLMEERGSTGDLSETWIVCGCGARRSMREATEAGSLGTCNGSRPWLDDIQGACGETNRLLVRTASNAYFPQLLSVISIPNSMTKTEEVVLSLWESHLCKIARQEELATLLSLIPELARKLEGLSAVEVFATIENIREGKQAAALAKPVKEVEFDALSAVPGEKLTDQPDGDFFARTLAPSAWAHPKLDDAIERIVLVHRLREVVALLGFTRFEPETTDITGELDLQVERAPIAAKPTWMPVAENRGEGLFIQFKPEFIEQWASQKPVSNREKELEESFLKWQATRPGGKKAELPVPSYLMLHSLSHLLITAISLECGYPLSSLRERIYAPDRHGAMKDRYGILIFTASAGAEGTLGGLVHAAREIRKHLFHALKLGKLCSNDPVCSMHGSSHTSMDRISGSACHGCLFISETSCERYNQFLDRALVVPTIEPRGCHFFDV